MYTEQKGMEAIKEWASVLESVKYRKNSIEYYAFCAIQGKVISSLTYLRNKEQCERTIAFIAGLETLEPLISKITQGYWKDGN